MKKGVSSAERGPSRLPAPEAVEIGRAFEENPVDGSALLRLCAHHLAAGERGLIQEALAMHLSAASGGSVAVRLRLAQAGELLPEQRAELLVDLSHVEAEQIGDASGALASAREALQIDPSLPRARQRFESLARGLDPVEMALDDKQLLEALEDDPVTDPGYRPPATRGAEAWATSGRPPPDMETTLELPILPTEQPAPDLADGPLPAAIDEHLTDPGTPGGPPSPEVASASGGRELPPTDEEGDDEGTDPGGGGPSTAAKSSGPLGQSRCRAGLYDPDPALARQCESLAERNDEVALGALAALERSCTSDGDRALVHRTISRVHESRGDRERAFTSLSRACGLAPPDRALLDELFRLAVMTGAYAELAGAYEEILSFNVSKPDRVYLHLKLGHLNARELARPADATRHYERVTSLDPHNVEALRRLGELLSREERWEEVAKIKQRELETVWLTTRDLGRAASVKRELARLYEEKLHDRQKALLLYRELLDLAPGNPAAIERLERMNRGGDDDETARRAFETLRDLYRRQGAYNRLADLFSQTARDVLGTGDVLRAASLHREAARAYETHLDDPGRAFIELVRAVQILPQGEATKGKRPDEEAVRATTDALFEDLLRAGRAARTHEQLMTVGEDLSLRVSGSRGASYLVRLVDAELEDLGDVGRAAGRLSRAVELSGNDPGLEARLEGLYVSRGSWPELSAFYRARADRLEDTRARSDLLFRLAEILEDELGDVEGAAGVYEEIIDLDGGNPDALAALCRLLEEGRSWSALVDALERAVTCADSLENKKASLLKRAKVYLEKLQNPEAARVDWQRVLAIDPQCVEALQGMAETVAEGGDAREAAFALEESLTAMRVGEPGRADGYRRLARLHADVLKQPARARVAWEEVLGEQPGDEEAFERLLHLYRDRGDLDPLSRLLGERLRERPHHADAKRWRRERIDALEKLGRGEEAGEEWWHAAQADPTDLEAHARLTAFHTARRNWKVVVRVLEDWLAAAGGAADKAELYFRLAEVHRHQFQDQKTALSAYEKALARAPEHAGAQNALLEIYKERGEPERMLPLLEARLRWTTEERERTQTLAEIWEVGSRLRQAGKEAAGVRALEALKEACLLAPDDAVLWEALRQALIDAGQAAELGGHLEARAARQEGAERAISLLEAAEAWREAAGPSDERGRERVRRCLERARDAAPSGHPVLREVLCQLREIYTAAEAWEAQAAILAQLADPSVSETAEDRKPLLDELAWLLIERVGRPLEAVGHLGTLMELASEEAERDGILGRLITLHGGLGEWHRVLALTEERVRLHRGTEREADLHLAAADIAERRLSDPEMALGHLRAALAVRPGDEETLGRVERVCGAAGRHGDHAAIVAEEARRAEEPGRAAALMVHAAAIKEQRLGDPAGARRELEAALALERLPEKQAEAARNALARILATLRAFDDLTALYRELIEAEEDAEKRADLCLALGLIQEEQRKDPEGALVTYREALEADPRNTAALDAVGRLSERSGDLDTALEMRTRQAEAASLAPQGADLYCSVAALHERRGDRAAALRCYERACEIDPGSSRALRGKLRLLRETGAGPEALDAARSLAEVAEEPEEVAALWAAIGESLEQGGDHACASDAYRRALGAVPDHGHACASLARLLLHEGKPTDALVLLDLAADRLEGEHDVEGLADVHRQSAAAYESLGRHEDARRKLHEAYRLSPTRRDTLEALALQFASREDPVRTHELLLTLMQHHGADLTRSEKVSVLRRIGLALAAMGRQGDAARKLDEALAIAPRDRDVLVALAGIYEETGRWAEVVEVKKKLLALSRSKRDQRRLSLEIAELFAHGLHDATRAARVLSQALDSHPDDPEILARLAEEHEKRGAYDEAATCLERIVGTAADGGPARLWVRLGRLRHERLGASLRALLAYRRALELASEATEIEEGLTAVRDLVAATRDARPLADVLAFLAGGGGAHGMSEASLRRELAEVLRYQLGDRAGAIEALERAVELEPDDLAAVEDLARLYEREGRDEDAMRTLRRVLQVSPFDVDAYRALLRVLKRQRETDGAALIASLLVLLEEADEEIEGLAAALGRPPAGGRALPEGPATPGFVHPDATGSLAGILEALGPEGLLPFAPIWSSKGRPLGGEAGPFADRCSTAILLAARAFGLDEPEVFVGPADMAVPLAPAIGGQGRILVSSSVVDGGRPLATTALKFQAGRAVLSTHAPFLAARVLEPEQLRLLLEAALIVGGAGEQNRRDASRLARKLERSLPEDRKERLSAAVAAHRAGPAQDLECHAEGVSHTVVRAGLLLSGSPEATVRILREEGEVSRGALCELVRFTISDEHLELRRALGWGPDER